MTTFPDPWQIAQHFNALTFSMQVRFLQINNMMQDWLKISYLFFAKEKLHRYI